MLKAGLVAVTQFVFVTSFPTTSSVVWAMSLITSTHKNGFPQSTSGLIHIHNACVCVCVFLCVCAVQGTL